MTTGPTIAYVMDPRMPGGTSSAVASELLAIAGLGAGLGRIKVHAIRSMMFTGDTVAPQLALALERLGLALIWDAATICADIVVLHNPVFLKFQTDLGCRILARHLIVVTHENFLRPGNVEAFDVRKCLTQIDRASLALTKSIAPVSPHNRATVLGWMASQGAAQSWAMLDQDWFNICDFPHVPATAVPADRRGRHSRPGHEKFPSQAVIEQCFPRHAESNVILGADLFLARHDRPPHWTLYPFRGLELDAYFAMFDFMVYFTAPTWRESFGRVLAEAVAAGKVVISDPETASAFGGAVVAAQPAEVDAIIQKFIADPKLYHDQVARGQAQLRRFSGAVFRDWFAKMAQTAGGMQQ